MVKIYCDMCDEQITGDNILLDMDKTKTSYTLEGALYRNSKTLYFTIMEKDRDHNASLNILRLGLESRG